jgi:hypothetical protein
MRTIVNHFDEVASACLAYPVTAGLAMDLSGCLLENILDMWPSCRGATRHERWTMTSTLFATGNAATDEQEALSFKCLCAANAIGVVGVSTIDNDISWFEMGLKLTDEVVNCRTSLHEKHNLARPLELGNKFFDGVCALNLGAYRPIDKCTHPK